MHTLRKNNLNTKDFTLTLNYVANSLTTIYEIVTSCDLILYGLRELDSYYNSFIYSMSLLMKFDRVKFEDFHIKTMSYERHLLSQKS